VGHRGPIAYIGVMSLAYEGLPAGLLEQRTAESAAGAALIGRATGRVVSDLGVVSDGAGTQAVADAAARIEALQPCAVVVRSQGAVRADLVPALGIGRGAPVLVWAPGDHATFPATHSPVDAVAGAGPVGAFALANELLRLGATWRVDADPRLSPDTLAWLRATGLAADLRAARFGTVAGPWPGMLDVALDAARFSADLGGTWEALELPQPESVTPAALGSLGPPDGLSSAVVERSCRLAAALVSAVESASLDAVAVRCHSDAAASHPGFGVMACLGVSLLSSRGIPATCTGDMVTAVAMFLATRLGGAAQYFEVDGPDADRNALLLSNGGEIDLRWARAESVGLVEQQFFSGVAGRGIAYRGVVEPGPATLIAFTPEPDGWRLITLEGDVLEEHLPDFPVPHAFLRSAGPATAAFGALGGAGTPHHVALTRGHVADVIAALCTLAPIRHVAL
jgi:L-arabinose isomerase